jgi:hypothetical protein
MCIRQQKDKTLQQLIVTEHGDICLAADYQNINGVLKFD